MEDFRQIVFEHPVIAVFIAISFILFLVCRYVLSKIENSRSGMYYDKFKKMSDPLSSDEVKFLKKYSKVKSLTEK